MTKINQNKIIVIVGPTASGKSDLGIKIARKINGEIISADSRQVYRGMDIGTGKVPQDRSNETRYYSSEIRHHLINVVSPKRQFTANNFKKLGEKAIKEIIAKNKVPVIVGGTGFYIDVLLGRMSVAEVPPNPELRKRLEKKSVTHLFKLLSTLDPQRSKNIDPKNKRRLIRALEIYIEGRKLKVESSLKTTPHLPHSTFKTLWIGLKPKSLEKRIKQRLNKRLQGGMVKEVINLHKQGVSWKRLDDFGLEYRWVSRYLNKNINYKDMKSGLLREITKYSKRQMTWFKRNKEIHWLKNLKEAAGLVNQFIL